MPAIDPPTPRPRTRLDDDAVARLDDLLHAVAEAGNGMPLEAVDGLFSCAILSPEPIAFGELLSLIFGPEHVWDSAAQAQEAMDLLLVLWNEIAQRVVRNPENDPRAEGPLLMLPDDYPLSRDAEDDQDVDAPPAPASESEEDADDADVARNLFGGSWAMGFLAGMQLRDAAWERLTRDDRDAAAAVADILSLIPMDAIEEAAQAEAEAAGEARIDDAGEDHELVDDEDAFDDETPISSETRAQIVEDLPWLLHDLHCARIAAATPREPVRRADEPGRNELCPCGSGKKYKKCCGDPARLH